MKCQLESILNQTFQNWELLIRDDGSTDDTLAIIGRYCREDSRINRIEHIASDQDGPKENFNALLGHALDSPARLIMFCDQDDYWYPDKIQTYFDLASVKNGPFLIYSDFELVDSQLMPIDAAHSFKNALNGGVDGTITDFLSLNHIPGCCIAINRELAMVASPIPADAIMHDWWLALTAASIGELLYIDEKLIKYRQHAANTVGVTSLTQLVLNLKQWPVLWEKGSEELCATMQQANELANRLGNENTLKKEPLLTLIQYAKMMTCGPYARLKIANQLGLRKGRGILRLVLYLRLLLLNCSPRSDSSF